MDVVLDIRDLAVQYKRGRPVLDGVTLSVPAGATLGVIGPNGAGKTTLLKVILGLIAPTRGTVTIAGMRPRDAARAGRIGYLPQSAASLATHLPIDVRQLVSLGLAGRVGLLNAASREDERFVDELIDRVGLAARRHAPIADLSGGLLQRALIARALASRPTLLLLDEPTVGIDARGQQAFVELLDALKRAMSLTMLFVSHDLRAVTSISDRIACVAGRVHFHDVPQHMPAELAYELFACDLDALGIEGGRRVALTPLCDDPGCDGHHHAASPLAPAAAGASLGPIVPLAPAASLTPAVPLAPATPAETVAP